MADEKGSSANDDDSGITMVDVLEEEQEREEDANAVLGASDDQNCTYSKGYLNRQALYACGTCTTSDKEPAGVCLACSYACHEGHELFELYTKRNFRCDCGNSKFPSNPCKLNVEKDATNEQNRYNQNFFGKYCICSRPYPDAEDDVPDEMVQCISCEDWYHGRHLGGECPENRDFGEMICSGCMDKLPFLWSYCKLNECTTVKAEDPNVVETVIVDDSPKDPCENSEDKEVATNGKSSKESGDLEKTGCLLEHLPNKSSSKGPSFWSVGWREKLCQCPKCLEMYTKLDCLYILKNEDTVHAYEEEGKASTVGQSQYDKGMLALNSLGRVQQVEVIHEYNSMKSKLKEYLKKFADSKKVVREEDIHEFFNSMQARKRQKVDVPHFCR